MWRQLLTNLHLLLLTRLTCKRIDASQQPYASYLILLSGWHHRQLKKPAGKHKEHTKCSKFSGDKEHLTKVQNLKIHLYIFMLFHYHEHLWCITIKRVTKNTTRNFLVTTLLVRNKQAMHYSHITKRQRR